MKKIQSLKLMLLGLFAFGSSNAMAQALGTEIEDANFVYTVTKEPVQKNGSWTTCEVEITRLKEDGKSVDESKNLIFPGSIPYTVGSVTKTYEVTTMAADLFKDNAYEAQHAVIPATLKEIPTGAFNTLTNLYDLTFAPESQVQKIGQQAFASTQIQKFDFSPCVKLEGLMDGVFVQTTTGENNKNANITEITLPTSTAFKHINGAFRNLTKLSKINNLKDSWIRELVDDAFAGCNSLLELELPGNDLLYISSKALEGSSIKKLTVNTGTGVTNGNPMKLLGGCTVKYFWDPINKEYVYNYEAAAKIEAGKQNITDYNNSVEEAKQVEVPTEETFPEWNPTDAQCNLYGLTAAHATATPAKIAPLINLTITGKLQGKICKNAFAWCSNINNAKVEDAADGIKAGINLAGIEFGTMGQIEEHAFLKDVNITALTIGDIKNNLLAGGFTIEKNAFQECRIATLKIGNIETANAIGSAAFGIMLKEVNIGTIKAGDAAFATGTVYAADLEVAEDGSYDNEAGTLASFVWADVTGTTLNIAQGEDQYVSNDNPANRTLVVPAGVFDFSAVDTKPATTPFVYPVVTIGQIASEGGVFAGGAIVGVNVDKLHFTGDIEANGLENAILLVEQTDTPEQPVVYEKDGDEDITYDVLPEGAVIGEAAGNFVEVEPGVYKQIKTPAAAASTTYNNRLSELKFDGKLKTNAIGTGAFINFVKMETLYFGGLMSKEAVAAGAFTNTGLVNKDGFIGKEGKEFVIYDANLTDNDASENPFASTAFGTADDERIIWWKVTDDKLAPAILGAIQIDVTGEAEDGKEYNPKFNVYKWVANLTEIKTLHGFIVYTDNKVISLDQNTDPTMAWGRYDLGSFNAEKGPDAGTRDEYTATDMIITRFLKSEGDGLKATGMTTKKEYDVKVTLYGVYYDEDPYAEQSSVYMVPLEVIDGQYQIPEDNTHLIIVKVKNLKGEFEDDQILIDFDAPEEDEAGQAGQQGDESEFLTGNSVWEQLQAETAGEGPAVDNPSRVFVKAPNSWTNQELVDFVTNEGGVQNIGVASDGKLLKDLYAMLNPAANAGFDVKRFVIERNTTGNGAYIGKNWYYALLKNYYKPATQQAQPARIIWLGEEDATAIFGVKGVDVKEALRQNDGAIYNLQGVRVSKAGKGVYIQNGQKFVVK